MEQRVTSRRRKLLKTKSRSNSGTKEDCHALKEEGLEEFGDPLSTLDLMRTVWNEPKTMQRVCLICWVEILELQR